MNIFQDPQTGDWYSGASGGGSEPDEDEALKAQGIIKDPFSGDYYQVPQSSIPHWQKPRPLAAPQAPKEITEEDGVGLGDYAKSVMAGGAQVAQAAGWLTRMLGAEDVGSSIEELGRDAVDYWNEGLSDAAKDALSREFVKKNEAGEWEWGDANLHTVGLFGAQSLLGSAAGAGAGAGITKVLQAFANPVGRSALLRAAQAGSEQALKKLAVVDKVIGAAGFAGGEGLVGGASAGVNVYDRVMQMPPEKITENERYRQVFDSTDESLPELERHQYAAETVAREASSMAGLQSGLTTALLGAPMGAFFGSMFGKSSIGKLVQSRAGRAGTGAAGEAAQEFAQGGAEQLIGNREVIKAGDTDVDQWDDVLNQALGGAVAGAPLGGLMGASEEAPIEPLPKTPSMEQMGKAAPPLTEPLRLTGPAPEADFTVGADGQTIPKGQTRPDQLALPAPRESDTFQVGADGAARRLTEAEARQASESSAAAVTEREQQATELGNRPVTVPGQDRKAWGKDTVERIKTVATEAVQNGAERETVLGIVRSAAKGETPPLVAQRRIRQLQNEAAAARKPKTLEAPKPSSTFEVAPTGEARQLSQAEARQANERVAAAKQAKVEMGTAPTVAPSLGGKRGQIVQKAWNAETQRRVESVAEEAVKAGVPREVADGVLTRMDKGEVAPLLATRQLKQLQRAQTTEAKTPEPAKETPKTPEKIDGAVAPVPRETPKPLLSRGGKTPEVIDFRDSTDFDRWVKENADDGAAQLAGDGVGEIELAPASKTTGLRGAKYDVPADVKSVYRTRDGRLFHWKLGESSGSKNPGQAIEVRPDDPRVKLKVKPRLSRDSKIPRGRNLSEEERRIEGDLVAKIEKDPEAAMLEYSTIPETLGGKLLNTDLARELSPDYVKDRKKSQAVHEPASWVVKKLYEKKLAEAPEPGDLPEVLFTAGGTGSGKTSGLRAAAAENPDVERAQIIYDTNMNGAKSSIQKIEQALAAGKTVRILYTYRDPVEALVGGALKRSKSQAKKYGTGRTVPLTAHAETHAGASATMREIAERYKNDARVKIAAYDNGIGGMRQVPVESLPQLDYDSVLGDIHDALNTEFEAGRIPEDIYRATLAGVQRPERARPARQDDQPSAPARESEAADAGRRREPAEVAPPAAPQRRAGAAQQAGSDALKRVQSELKDFTAGIDSLVNVRIHENAAAMSEAIGQQVPDDTKGAWLPGDSTVHIVAETHAPGEAIQTAVHEVFGHLAMERYEEGQRAIESVKRQIQDFAPWTRPYVRQVRGTHGLISDTEMAKEVIALMAERGEKNLTMTKLIAGIRRFLRKLGVKIDYSDSDIRDLIARSARALKREAVRMREKLAALTPAATDQQILEAIDQEIPAAVVSIDAYMALRAARDKATGDTSELDAEIARMEGRQPEGDTTLRLKKPLRSAQAQTDTPAFKKWFGDSKAVDKKGEPIRLYHGTGRVRDFDTFDVTGTTGIYLTDQPELASEYATWTNNGAGRVVPLFASLQNPYVVDAKGNSYMELQSDDWAGDMSTDGVSEWARGRGHDGVIIRNTFDPPGGLWSDSKVKSDIYVAFKPEQVKSAIGNTGTFDPSNPSFLFSRAANADPDVQAILDRVMVKPPEAMTMRDKARELWHKITDTSSLQLKQGFIDSFASIEALERDANDGKLKDAAESAYKSALATKNLSSVMAGVMLKGVPQFQNGTYQPAPGRKSILDIFDPLTKHKDGNLLSQWEGYAAARRASRLIKEKNIDGTNRENLFTQAEIDTLLKLEKRYPEFAKVFDEWQVFNKQVLDLAQEAGVIDPETRALWERNDYVPFYRVAEELGNRSGPSNKAGLANQSSGIKKLSGSDKMLGNVFENMMMNTAHLIDASFKNRAMQRIVELGTDVAMNKVELDWEAVKFNDAQMAGALRKAGIEVDSMNKAQREHWSTLFKRVAPKGPNIVSVMKNGKPEYYEVTDPLVLQSIAGLGYDNFADVFGLFRGSKKLLTHAITADPAFMLANFVRDTLSNWVISDASTKPLVDAVKAMGATLRDDPDLVQLMMAGAGGGGFYDSAPEDIRKLIADRVPAAQQRAFLDSVVGPKNVWRVWRKVGAAAENANRIATFRAVLAAGGTVAEAAYQARDVLNFSMAGNFGAMRWLTQSVPFLNARVQGLYRLYRGARDNKRAFFMKGLMLSAATMALALSNEDDEEYEELPEWDKDTYWHLFLGGEHYRIPKPFEVGALFSTIPERLYRTATGRDSAGLLADRMFQMTADTFAFNPVPQLVKPIIEQYANRSMFTGSPIVGQAEQNLQPEAQFTPWTSETMQELAKLMPDFAPAWLRSPKRLEAALRAYTGAIGMYLLGASDSVVRTAMGYAPEPSKKVYDLPVVGRFWKDPDPRHTKYADQLYEMMDEANAISSTVNRFTRERRFEEAAELRTANKDKLAVRIRLNRLGTQVRNVNNQIRLIQLDRGMSPDLKRERIDGLVERKNKITREVARYGDVF